MQGSNSSKAFMNSQSSHPTEILDIQSQASVNSPVIICYKLRSISQIVLFLIKVYDSWHWFHPDVFA